MRLQMPSPPSATGATTAGAQRLQYLEVVDNQAAGLFDVRGV
jgi:hypothetical protein